MSRHPEWHLCLTGNNASDAPLVSFHSRPKSGPGLSAQPGREGRCLGGTSTWRNPVDILNASTDKRTPDLQLPVSLGRDWRAAKDEGLRPTSDRREDNQTCADSVRRKRPAGCLYLLSTTTSCHSFSCGTNMSSLALSVVTAGTNMSSLALLVVTAGTIMSSIALSVVPTVFSLLSLLLDTVVSGTVVPEVVVTHGALKGSYLTSRNGREFVAFRGIQYAKPPLGELRFRCGKFDKYVAPLWYSPLRELCYALDLGVPSPAYQGDQPNVRRSYVSPPIYPVHPPPKVTIGATCNAPIYSTLIIIKAKQRCPLDVEEISRCALLNTKPNIQELSPKPPSRWSGVRNATEDTSPCTQRSIFARQVEVSGSEDCLYLNVYTPQLPDGSSDVLPVMVWFHGGGWVSGAGTSKFYGPQFLLDKDIVLVTVTYRLGPIGFLSTGDEAAPGNFGLKDQVAALRWVQDNIAVFGGNPNSVTIFGESAGGASVHYHILSPLSQGLFHRGISQSGTALCSWTLAPNGSSKHQAQRLATLLNCPSSPSKALVDCLRRREAKDIIATDKDFMEWDVDPLIPFKPVVETTAEEGEDIFIPDHPLNMILNKSREFNIPWITGLNSGDGGLKAAPIFAKDNLVQDLDREFDRVAPISMFYGETSLKTEEVSQRIRDFYFGDKPINNDTLHSVVDMFTDNWFLSGADQAVKLQVEVSSAPVYYYYFDYRGTKSFSELFSGLTTDFDFARTGNPTPDEKDVAVRWQPITSSNLEYLHIGSDVYMDSGLLKERAEFWASLPVRPNLHKDEL
uniref:Carboxylesterase type B domain-containing protein n=1 Tax=Timema poppense TaxID=170557 RepID=A0A7R9CX11_TIMPO|nr:unnamed protein product [Timema poppensis]